MTTTTPSPDLTRVQYRVMLRMCSYPRAVTNEALGGLIGAYRWRCWLITRQLVKTGYLGKHDTPAGTVRYVTPAGAQATQLKSSWLEQPLINRICHRFNLPLPCWHVPHYQLPHIHRRP